MDLSKLTLTELKELHTKKVNESIEANYESPIDIGYADAKDEIDEIQNLIWDLEDEAPVMGSFDENGDCI